MGDVLWAQKAGNSKQEYEDSFWPKRPLDGMTHECRIAVADGATETSYSRIWAKHLVRAYGQASLEDALRAGTLEGLQAKWEQIVSRLIARRKLPWYAEQKAQSGAFAAIVGLTICDSPTGGRTWKSTAVGDSCLVQIRGDDVLAKFPLSDSAQFDNSPFLVSTKAKSNDLVAEMVRDASGLWEEGDVFYLLSDAVACWFYKNMENGEQPWRVLRDLGTDDHDFSEWLGQRRDQQEMRNDDVTIYRVDLT
jgi:hypothetical protein